MNSNKIIMIGLPESGKTTFLAALWFLVDGKHKTSLTLAELHGDHTYLNLIRDQWLSCTTMTRTAQKQLISMKLIDKINSRNFELSIPDSSGETYEEQWDKRAWSTVYMDEITSSSGALLFINPAKLDEPTRIDEAEPLISELSSSQSEKIDTSSNANIEWSSKISSTQAKLIDLLQFIQDGKVSRPFRLAIIVSAWDLIEDKFDSPNTWLKNRLPLLHQFLESNADSFPSKSFGVSAQGVDYDDNSSTQKIKAWLDQGKRIKVVDPPESGKDLTIPIIWLIE